MINLELYRVFYTVAKCGSLTRAAQELFISQPAVSQSIKQLEKQLGVNLFNRTHTGMELSAAGGKLIYKKVEQAISLLDEAENSLKDLDGSPTGTLRIAASNPLFSHILADKMVLFNEKHPAVELKFINSTSQNSAEMLKDGRCDIAFAELPLAEDGVQFYVVANLSDVFVSGKKFSSLKGQTLSLERLQDLPLLTAEENILSDISTFSEAFGVRLNSDIMAINYELLIRLTVNGMGVACMPREYCAKELNSGELFELNVTPPLPARAVGMILPKNAGQSLIIREFAAMFTGDKSASQQN